MAGHARLSQCNGDYRCHLMAAEVERHPLEPFLPENGKLLMLGSFPPQRKRWSMEFYYPNFTNDMWRVFGLLFFGDPLHFVDQEARRFRKEEIVAFLSRIGVGLYDTACAVRRLQDNASDKFLEVVESTDVEALLCRMPHCKAVVTTGQKATDTICACFGVEQPPMGGSVAFQKFGREMRLYRMPSTSRAYPLALERKAAVYREMFREIGLI